MPLRGTNGIVTMNLRLSLTALSITAVAMLSSAGPVLATTGSAGPADAEATARCIVRNLPHGGQIFRASDGSMRVRAAGRRGLAAQWTIGADGSVSQSGGKAGIAQALAGTCY